MADPRKIAAFEGIAGVYATFQIDDVSIVYDAAEPNGSAQVGFAVTLSDDAEVALVGDGEFVLGKLISVERDGFCTVHTGGYMTLPGGTAATLTPGTKIVGDLLVAAEGYIQTVGTGSVAAESAGNGRIIDATTTTAVVVNL